MATSKSLNLPSTCGRIDIALVGSDEITTGAFVEINVKVIEPEVDEEFFELMVAVDGAVKLLLEEIVSEHAAARPGNERFA